MSSGSLSSRTSVSSSALTKPFVLAVALGGCMKIYPDPELPDVVITWDEFTCEDAPGQVHISLYDFDGATPLDERTAPCSALSVRFDDVARERYRLEGELVTADRVIPTEGVEADLRDGVNERVFMYFDTFSNLRVEWTFAPGSSCATLGALWVAIDVSLPDETFEFSNTVPCDLPSYMTRLAEDTFRIRVRAISNSLTTVGVAPDEEVVIGAGLTDLAVVLAPCGADCPEPPTN